jgi:hypothetical protein
VWGGGGGGRGGEREVRLGQGLFKVRARGGSLVV